MKATITEIKFETPFNYLELNEDIADMVVDNLLALDNVTEVTHYAEIIITCTPDGNTDQDVIDSLNTIRKNVYNQLYPYFA